MSAAAAGAAVGAGAGGLVGGLTSFFGGREARKQAKALWREQNAWAVARERYNQQWVKDMDREKYLREVEGLKMAGLNPMLAYSAGGNVPNASSGQTPNAPPIENIGEHLGEGIDAAVSSAMSAYRTSEEMRALREDIGVKQKTQGNIEADTGLKKVNSALAEQQAEATDASRLNTKQDTEVKKAQENYWIWKATEAAHFSHSAELQWRLQKTMMPALHAYYDADTNKELQQAAIKARRVIDILNPLSKGREFNPGRMR